MLTAASLENMEKIDIVSGSQRTPVDARSQWCTVKSTGMILLAFVPKGKMAAVRDKRSRLIRLGANIADFA